MAFDGTGDLLISDLSSGRIRLVAAANCSRNCPFGRAATTKGYIYTIAGGGSAGYNGPAKEARILPLGVAVDAYGNLVINHDLGVTLVAATNCSSACPYGLPATIKGYIYALAGSGEKGLLRRRWAGYRGPAHGRFRDGERPKRPPSARRQQPRAPRGRQRLCDRLPVRALGHQGGNIYTIAGNGTYGSTGDGAPAATSGVGNVAITVDRAGNLLLAEAYRIRLVAAATCATACAYGLPATTKDFIYTIAGTGGEPYSQTPPGGAMFSSIAGTAVDQGGNVLVSDADSDRIRVVAAADCASNCPYALPSTSAGDVYTIAGVPNPGIGFHFSGDGGPAAKAALYSPAGIAVAPSGDVLIADSANNRVRLVASATCSSNCPYGLAATTKGSIYTVAGNGSPFPAFAGDGGPAKSAPLSYPSALTVDSGGNLLFNAFSRVRLVAAASCESDCPYGLPAMTRGSIYTVAGNGTLSGGDGGPATSAGLAPFGLAVTAAGDLLVATSDNRIRLVASATCAFACPYGPLSTRKKGSIYTIAGTGAAAFSGDGGAATSTALSTRAITVDPNGNVLIADSYNHRVRLLAATTCTSRCAYGLPSTTAEAIHTVAGSGTETFSGDGGPATSAGLSSPYGLTVDQRGHLLVNDSGNARLRLVSGVTDAAPTPRLTPATHAFPLTLKGRSSPPQTVTVTNPGPGTLTIGALRTAGPDASAFHLGANSCSGAALAGGTSCSVAVTFSATAPGVKTGTLQIPDDAANSPQAVKLQGTATSAPTFTTAAPPVQVGRGETLGYTFVASAYPTPEYRLVGAPSWMTIDPASGKLGGTVPSEIPTFNYSVSATNQVGSVTLGPFSATTVTPVKVEGTVKDKNGIGVGGVVVNACVVSGSLCFAATTDPTGSFTLSAVPGRVATIKAFPPPRSSAVVTTLDPVVVPEAGLRNQNITITGLTSLDMTLTDAPGPATLYGSRPTTATFTGCAHGIGVITVTGTNSSTGQPQTNMVPSRETPTGSGRYVATIPPQSPFHGPVDIQDSVRCPEARALVPDAGPAPGGCAVIVTGSGFTDATAVLFGETPAVRYTVVDDQSIQAVAPAGTGTVPVTVSSGGSTTVLGQYTYIGVRSVSPTGGPSAGGTTVRIAGTGLKDATGVLFGSTPAQFTQVSDTEIDAVSPPGIGAEDVTVTTFYGATPVNDGARFSYGGSARAAARPSASPPARELIAAPPAFASLRPASLTMTLGDESGSLWTTLFEFVQDKAIKKLPAGWQASVLTALAFYKHDCTKLQAAQLAILMAELDPLINILVKQVHSFVMPEVTVFLNNYVLTKLPPNLFTAVGAVAVYAAVYYGIKYAIHGWIEDFVRAHLANRLTPCPPKPPHPPKNPNNALIDPSGNVIDTNGNPVSGATVTILRSETATGTFTPVDITAGGIEPTINPEITGADGFFHWDVSAGWYKLTARAPGCSAPTGDDPSTATLGPLPVPPPQLGLWIELLDCPSAAPSSMPVIESLSTDNGPVNGGTEVTLLGRGFTPSTQVSFGGHAATVTYLSPLAIRVVTPAGVGLVNVVARTAGGTSAKSAFFYGKPPTITRLSADRGPTEGGDTIIITGSDFTGATAVTFGGVPAGAFTVKSDTEIQVTAPAAAGGTVDVAVVSPAGAGTSTTQYTFVPEVPVCAPLTLAVAADGTVTVPLSCSGKRLVYDQPRQPPTARSRRSAPRPGLSPTSRPQASAAPTASPTPRATRTASARRRR